MKRQSLVYQAKKILSEQFSRGFGRSKYVDRVYEANKNIIYSRNTYKSALQKCCTFLSYCKEKFKVKNLKGIRDVYFTQFVKDNEYKADTAEGYRWAIQKLQNGYNAVHSTDYVWTSEEYKQYANNKAKKSRIQMPVDIHEEIIRAAYANQYTNGLAFDIARALGLRVSEITNLRMNNFEFDKANHLKAVYIHRSKGGRNRRIPISCLSANQTATVVRVYRYFSDKRDSKDRLFINKADSYRKAFAVARNSVTKDYTQCGVHSLRKEFSNSYFVRNVVNGVKKTMWGLTRLLGHNRVDVLRHYIVWTT